MTREVLSTTGAGLARGLLLFAPWAAFRYFWLWQMPVDHVNAAGRVTDFEIHSLDLAPGSDLFLLLGLAGFAVGLSLLFLLRPDHRRKSAVWALAAGSLLIAAFSTILLPVLAFRCQEPGKSIFLGSYEQIAWIHATGLVFVWIVSIGVLRIATAKS